MHVNNMFSVASPTSNGSNGIMSSNGNRFFATL